MKRPLVAIVDDDELFRRSVERLIESAGFSAETFGSAEDFLEHGHLDATACAILEDSQFGQPFSGLGGLCQARLDGPKQSTIPATSVRAELSANTVGRRLVITTSPSVERAPSRRRRAPKSPLRGVA